MAQVWHAAVCMLEVGHDNGEKIMKGSCFYCGAWPNDRKVIQSAVDHALHTPLNQLPAMEQDRLDALRYMWAVKHGILVVQGWSHAPVGKEEWDEAIDGAQRVHISL